MFLFDFHDLDLHKLLIFIPSKLKAHIDGIDRTKGHILMADLLVPFSVVLENKLIIFTIKRQ